MCAADLDAHAFTTTLSSIQSFRHCANFDNSHRYGACAPQIDPLSLSPLPERRCYCLLLHYHFAPLTMAAIDISDFEKWTFEEKVVRAGKCMSSSSCTLRWSWPLP